MNIIAEQNRNTFEHILFQNICKKYPRESVIKKNIKTIKHDYYSLFEGNPTQNEELVFELVNYLIPDYERNYFNLDNKHPIDTKKAINHMKSHYQALWLYIEKYIYEIYNKEFDEIHKTEQNVHHKKIKKHLSLFLRKPIKYTNRMVRFKKIKNKATL